MRKTAEGGMTLARGLRELALDPALAEPLSAYLAELARWNAAYNLTAVRDPDEMVVRHVLDSLALLPAIDAIAPESASAAWRVLDVGSGAGLPGIPLALARPQWQVDLLDSNGKKARFLRHAQRTLKIGNARVVEARAEAHEAESGYDAVVSRAFASLGDFAACTRHLLAPGGRWLAMKGRVDVAEQGALPAGVVVVESRRLVVPGLDEERHVVVMA